ncbi:Disease Related Nonspecific Lipid Transfer Protein 1 [Hibiscus trionum]|uniref:Disease Related Nonspecific Lipid Transfer Protein 1 n=1 Tax=Hibiscus trionum TaxID=183268 RepID=A0A9W7LTU2_HIBTR|nr:Disease Related Nonspecific Lipid Transfer Protein 1 [Hibiscus trionum]GMI75006.1 Disease Related Nonspecific Lipid Transfer Protein 1 [Hibiscus trionum]
MASKASAPIVLLLSLNLVFFTLVTSQTPPPPALPCNITRLTSVCIQPLQQFPILPIRPNATCCQALVAIGTAGPRCLCRAVIDAIIRIFGITVSVNIPLTDALRTCGVSVPGNFTCTA